MDSDHVQLEADIERANKAWTEEDVRFAAAAAATARHENPEEHDAILTPTISHNPCQTEALVEVDKGVCRFWKKRG